MNISQLTPEGYKVMPWKNKQGSTVEMIIEPPDASLDNFSWRISSAHIESKHSHFSLFPNYSRILIQLEGPAIKVHHQHCSPLILSPLESVHYFSGDTPTECFILSDQESVTVRDFNVITRNSEMRATASLITEETSVTAANGTQLFYVANGVAEIEPHGTETKQTFTVRKHEILRLNNENCIATVHIKPKIANIALSVIHIELQKM